MTLFQEWEFCTDKETGVSWGPTFLTLWFFILNTTSNNEIQDGLMLCLQSWEQIWKAEGVRRCQLKKQPVMVSSTFCRESGCEGEVKAHFLIFNGVFSFASGCSCAQCLPTEHYTQSPVVKWVTKTQELDGVKWVQRSTLCVVISSEPATHYCFIFW